MTPYRLLVNIIGSADRAHDVLAQYGELHKLRDASLDDLRACGLPIKTARRLQSAIELGARCADKPCLGDSFAGSYDLYKAYKGKMNQRQEVFVLLCLNNRNQVIDEITVAKGTVNECPVQAREVFRPAILASAARVILMHNHPSGDPTPSPHDVALTRRLCEVGEMVGVPVLDHIVFGGGYSSLRDLGLMTGGSDD